MLQSRKPGTDTCVPVHVIFEQRERDAYKVEESSLTIASLWQSRMQIASQSQSLLEQQEIESYKAEENVSILAPSLQEEMENTPNTSALERGDAEIAEQVVSVAPEAQPISHSQVPIKFRQAQIEVDDADAFWEGVIGGQVAMVEEQRTLTGALVFELFEDAVRDLEFSETWLAGYLLGLSDALLKCRKLYPREYNSRLKPLNSHSAKPPKS